MSQYVVRLVHTSDQCPMTNSKVRERLLKGAPELSLLAKQLGVKFLIGPLVLSCEHTSFAVVEADRIEMVEDLILQGGLSQWNSVHVSMAKPIEQAMKDMEKAPAPIY